MQTVVRATVLILLCTGSAFAQKVGNQIIVTADTAHLKSRNDEVGSVPKWSILTVKKVNADWFWVAHSGRDATIRGWIKRSDVVSLNKGLDFINIELERAPTAENLVVRGAIRTAMFAYDEAIADHEAAIRLDQANAGAYFNRGKAWFWKGEYERAIADHNQAIRLDPKNALVYHSRGFVRQCSGDWDNTIADYVESIRLDPENADVYYSRAYAWHCRHQFEEAIADYTKSIELGRTNSDVYANRGGIWEHRDEYDKAIADYSEQIRLEPEVADGYDHRGRTWERKGDYERALADYTEAVRLDPTFLTSAAIKLAFLLATCPDDKYRDGKRAVELARQLCEDREFSTFESMHTLAAAYAEIGDFANAVKWEELVVARASKKDKPAIQYHLELYKSARPYRKARPEPLLRSSSAKGCSSISDGSDTDK